MTTTMMKMMISVMLNPQMNREQRYINSQFLSAPSGITLLILLAIGLILTVVWLSITQTNSWLYLYTLLASAIISSGLGFFIVPLLEKLKAAQIIQEDGPQSHQIKAGTPTMGGIFFVPVAIGVAAILAPTTPGLIAISLVTLAYGLIGWIDDFSILRQKSNKGISPKQKLSLQLIVALGFCLWLGINLGSNLTSVELPFSKVISLGWLFWPLGIFVMTAESNATNLTDGVDGLATGTGAIAFLAMGIIISSTHPDLAVFSISFSGACLGFLVHNRHKAKVFMGDTGSLAIGGSLGAIGVYTGQLWALFIVSGIFFVESLSVILQVYYYKITKGPDGQGKRLFKMAPLHHHLEESGWQETQVVGVFYLINAILAGFVLTFS